jgi:hypothetical protein
VASKNNSHEDFSREDDVQVGSERSFGFVFAAVFGIIAIIKAVFGAGMTNWTIFWFTGSGIFLAIALIIPRILRPLNIVWFKFGLLLNSIVSPVIMGLLFFVTVTPIGLLMRLFGKRPLNLKFEPEAESYWIHRTPPGPEAGSFKNQF